MNGRRIVKRGNQCIAIGARPGKLSPRIGGTEQTARPHGR
jgi:hypothetical protein